MLSKRWNWPVIALIVFSMVGGSMTSFATIPPSTSRPRTGIPATASLASSSYLLPSIVYAAALVVLVTATEGTSLAAATELAALTQIAGAATATTGDVKRAAVYEDSSTVLLSSKQKQQMSKALFD